MKRISVTQFVGMVAYDLVGIDDLVQLDLFSTNRSSYWSLSQILEIANQMLGAVAPI